MKLSYLEPKADIRFLLSQDIIAESEEAVPPVQPEGQNPDDAVVDPF